MSSPGRRPGSLGAVLRRPVVVAPMAGGPSAPALVVAAAEAGALGFLAAGYKMVDAVKAEMEAVRASTPEAFGVNVFVPGRPTARPAEVATYVEGLAADAEAVGGTLGDAVWDDDDWDAKLEALLDDPPPVVSFTFGRPEREVVRALRAAGSLVMVTVTTSGEAALAAEVGPDGLCVQGVEAGAHQGVFSNDRPLGVGRELLDLLGEVTAMVDLPVVAAGGVMSAEDVGTILRAGAVAAQCGTAFLRCPESGAQQAHKDALADPRFTATALTRAFSGRPARGLVNQFMMDHADAPAAYPEVNNATRPLRAAAARSGDVDRMSLWAGTGFRQATTGTAGEIVDRLDPR